MYLIHITGRETKKNENSVVSQQKHSIVTFCFHRQEFQHFSPPKGASGIPTSYSAYYNISVAKAELLNKLKQQPEMAEAGLGEEGVDYELAQKKVRFWCIPESFSIQLSVRGQPALRTLQHVFSTCV